MAVRRILVALATLLAPMPLLAACGGGGDSVADPPISSSPTSSPTTQHRESPEHFIRRWAAEEKRMENTGKTDMYLSLSRHCRACRQLASDIRRYYAAGGYAHWGGWRIHSILKSGSSAAGIAYTVRVVSCPTAYRKSADTAVQHLAGGPATHQLVIRWTGSGWQVMAKAQVAT